MRSWKIPSLSAALFIAFCLPGVAQSSGAIYTTNQTGSLVNGNLYNQATQVYLNAGPGPGNACSGTGLANGAYYFQVTSPSGLVLLSSDPLANRVLIASGGFVSSTTGTHNLRNGACPGSKIVQLAPFNNTPSPGGEYKVWLTPVARYDPTGAGFHGFLAKYSKTDNFKVRLSGGPAVLQSTIEGHKFYDRSENGVWERTDPFEVPIAGWRIEIWLNGVFNDVTFTDEGGRYEFIRVLNGAIYEIREVAPPPGFIPAPGGRWLPITPRQGLVSANAAVVAGPEFGNLQFVLTPGVGRSKGFWHNEGASLLAICDPTWRTALNAACLRTNISTLNPQLSLFILPLPPADFSVTFAYFSNWIVGEQSLGHAGFMLSTQVAATILNNTCGFMQGTIYIDRFQNNQLVSLSSMLSGVSAMLLCDPNAGITGPNDPFSPSPFPPMSLRDAMLNCLNEFDNINNTGTATSPQIVYGPSPTPDDFPSPYEP